MHTHLIGSASWLIILAPHASMMLWILCTALYVQMCIQNTSEYCTLCINDAEYEGSSISWDGIWIRAHVAKDNFSHLTTFEGQNHLENSFKKISGIVCFVLNVLTLGFLQMTTIFLGGHPNNPAHPVTIPLLSMYFWAFISISVCLCPCLCACAHVFVSLWYIFSARPKHSAPPPPVHPCLCVSDGAGKRWGGSCSSYLQTPLSHIFFYWRGQKLLAMSLTQFSLFKSCFEVITN